MRLDTRPLLRKTPSSQYRNMQRKTGPAARRAPAAIVALLSSPALHLRLHKQLQEDHQLLEEGRQTIRALPQQSSGVRRNLRSWQKGITVR